VNTLEQAGMFDRFAQLLKTAKASLANDLMTIVWKSFHVASDTRKTCVSAGLIPFFVQHMRGKETKTDALNCLEILLTWGEKDPNICQAFRDHGGIKIILNSLKAGGDQDDIDMELNILTNVLAVDQESCKIALEAGCVRPLVKVLTQRIPSPKARKSRKHSSPEDEADINWWVCGLIADALSCTFVTPMAAQKIAANGDVWKSLVPLLQGPSYPACAAAAALAVLFEVDSLSRSAALRSGLKESFLKDRFQIGSKLGHDERFELSASVTSFLGIPRETWQPPQLATIALAALEEWGATPVGQKRSAVTSKQLTAKAPKRK